MNAITQQQELQPTCPKCSVPQASQERDDIYCNGCCFPLILLGNRYALLQELATGGGGVVYLAEDLDTGDEVAIKVPKRGSEENLPNIPLFRQEIQITKEIGKRNQHCVTVFDSGDEPGFGPYYVMEYLHGQSLRGYLFRNGAPRLSEALHLFAQLCFVMEDTHRLNIVHRDLKPENIFLLPRRDGSFEIKVFDFGIAKKVQQPQRMVEGTVGSPAYMSPEQCIDGEIDHRSDIYTMGVLLYELLTGVHPYEAEHKSTLSVLYSHMREEAEPMSNKRPGLQISSALEAIVAKAMAKDPGQRFQSVREFWDALQACAGVNTLPALQVESPIFAVSSFSSTRLNAFVAHEEVQESLEEPVVAPPRIGLLVGMLESIVFR